MGCIAAMLCCCCAEGKSNLLLKGSNADPFSYTRNMLGLSYLIIDKCHGILFFAGRYFYDVFSRFFEIKWRLYTGFSACCLLLSYYISFFFGSSKIWPQNGRFGRLVHFPVHGGTITWHDKWDMWLRWLRRLEIAYKAQGSRLLNIAYWGTLPKELIGFVERDDGVHLILEFQVDMDTQRIYCQWVRENEAEWCNYDVRFIVPKNIFNFFLLTPGRPCPHIGSCVGGYTSTRAVTVIFKWTERCPRPQPLPVLTLKRSRTLSCSLWTKKWLGGSRGGRFRGWRRWRCQSRLSCIHKGYKYVTRLYISLYLSWRDEFPLIPNTSLHGSTQ